MRIKRLKTLTFVLGTGGFLLASVNCVPTRNQLNSTLNSGIMNGIEFALTVGITNLLLPGSLDTTPTTTADTTATE